MYLALPLLKSEAYDISNFFSLEEWLTYAALFKTTRKMFFYFFIGNLP